MMQYTHARGIYIYTIVEWNISRIFSIKVKIFSPAMTIFAMLLVLLGCCRNIATGLFPLSFKTKSFNKLL